jgi:GNAT superfamily N-acetyltransferase
VTTPDFSVRDVRSDERALIGVLDARSAEEGQAFRGADAHEASLGAFDDRWPVAGLPDSRRFVVVTVGDVIVGFASVEMDADPRPLLTRIHVRPEARSLGAGATLLRHVLAEARRLRGASLDALSLPGDRETKNLYERQGMKARLIVATSGE